MKLSDGGVRYDKNKVLLIIRPSDKSIEKFKNSIRDIFVKSCSRSAYTLISKLNPVIRGWCQSKQAWHCNRIFNRLNDFLFHKVYRWCIRAHPTKSHKWIKARYFTSLNVLFYNNNWVFSYPNNRKIIMWSPNWFKPYKHPMTRSDACPDDRSMRQYFSDLEISRFNSKPIGIYDGFRTALALEQRGVCPVCESDLFNGEPLHVHHIIERAKRGLNTKKNLILLYGACHYRITYGTDSNQWRESFVSYKELLKSKE